MVNIQYRTLNAEGWDDARYEKRITEYGFHCAEIEHFHQFRRINNPVQEILKIFLKKY